MPDKKKRPAKAKPKKKTASKVRRSAAKTRKSSGQRWTVRSKGDKSVVRDSGSSARPIEIGYYQVIDRKYAAFKMDGSSLGTFGTQQDAKSAIVAAYKDRKR